MAIPSSIIGTTFFATQVSIGSASGSSPAVTYTEQKLLSDQKVLGTAIGPNGTLTITAVGPPDASGVQTITGVINNSPATFANGQSLTGTTIGVDGTDFLVTGNFAGFSGTFYVTNTPAMQPGAGQTAIVATPDRNVTYNPACYCAGTLIRIERGEVPVEQLAIGDSVWTLAGGLQAIRWIGSRSYQGRFLAGHSHLQPIRFSAGSLGDGLPRRDLLVSPKHAMFIDGVLVEAELLVNGTTINRVIADRVDYFHIELDAHAVIWAEGTLSETFVDDESRGVFHNAATYRTLYPDAVSVPASYCAPRVTDGPMLDAIIQRLAACRSEFWKSFAVVG